MNNTVYKETMKCFIDQLRIIKNSNLDPVTKHTRIEQIRVWYSRLKFDYTTHVTDKKKGIA